MDASTLQPWLAGAEVQCTCEKGVLFLQPTQPLYPGATASG
jgi:hypothetical protein